MTISASFKKSSPDSFRKEFTPLPILLFRRFKSEVQQCSIDGMAE
jgi:hypothetical protein